MLRKATSWFQGSRKHVQRAAKIVVSVIDKLTGTNFVKSSDVHYRAIKYFGARTGRFTKNSELDDMTRRALDAYLTYENMMCWDVNCVHVADYLDESFEKYHEHESMAVKLLPRLCDGRIGGKDYFDARKQARELLDFIKRDYEVLKAHLPNEAQGAVSTARVNDRSESEEDTLP